MEVTKVPKKIVTVIEPKRSMTVDKEKYRQKRVAAYCRVSTDSEEQLVSYANQKKVYTEMIASRKDWCFAGLFADEGKSGRNRLYINTGVPSSNFLRTLHVIFLLMLSDSDCAKPA